MLCVYGLGDFVAGYANYPDTIMSAMMTCDIVCGDDGSPAVENVVWHPLIEHREGSTDTVYLVRDYSSELAGSNELLAGLDSPYDWLIETTKSVIGEDFKIDASS